MLSSNKQIDIQSSLSALIVYVFDLSRNEDLLVGAPYYAVNINEGAVYAYVNTGNVS